MATRFLSLRRLLTATATNPSTLLGRASVSVSVSPLPRHPVPKVVGSLEEARMKMYTVSTENGFHFRACISEEQAGKLFEMEGVDSVIPDVFEDDRLNEPFSILDAYGQSQKQSQRKMTNMITYSNVFKL